MLHRGLGVGGGVQLVYVAEVEHVAPTQTGEASNTSQRHVYQVGDYDHIGEEGRGNGDVPRPTQGKAGLDLTMLIGLHLLTSNFLIASALNGSMLTSHLVKSSFQVLFLCCGCPPCVWE